MTCVSSCCLASCCLAFVSSCLLLVFRRVVWRDEEKSASKPIQVLNSADVTKVVTEVSFYKYFTIFHLYTHLSIKIVV